MTEENPILDPNQMNEEDRQEFYLDVVFAARYGDLEDLEELIASNPKQILLDAQDENQNKSIHMAAANGHDQVVQFIIDTINDPSQLSPENNSGNTPLHWAALNGHLNILRLICPLLPREDLSKKNGLNRTAFTEAESRQTKECMECAGYLLELLELEKNEREEGTEDLDDDEQLVIDQDTIKQELDESKDNNGNDNEKVRPSG